MTALGMTPLLIKIQPLIEKPSKTDEDYSDIFLLWSKASPAEKQIIDKWEETAKQTQVVVKHDFTEFKCDKSHAGPCDHSSSVIVDLEKNAPKSEEKTEAPQAQKENEKPLVNYTIAGRRFSLSVKTTPSANSVENDAVEVSLTASRLTFS